MATEVVQPALSPDQISAVQAQADAIAASATFAVSPKTFVFFAAFDGTFNIKTDLKVAGDKQSTAVGELSDQVIQSLNVRVGYYPGVGTPGTLPLSFLLPTEQAIATAQEAYNDFSRLAANWLANPDNAGGSVTAMEVSFSRGSVAAAIFSQMLYENGLVAQSDITDAEGTVVIPAGTMLIAPGEVPVTNNLVISPVVTGATGNLAFAPNVQNTTVVLADNEYRSLYVQATYDQPGVTTIRMAGDHGDVASLYDSGIGGIGLEGYQKYLINTGLSVAPVLPSRQFNPDAPVVIHAETFDLFHPQNIFSYGSVAENTPIRTDPVGTPALVESTSNGDVTTLVDYAGKTVTVNKIGDDTQSVTIRPAGEATGTTVNYTDQASQPDIQTIIGADGATTVNAFDGSGVLLQSTTTLPGGEIDQTDYTNGIATSVTKTLPTASDGSTTANTYDGTGTTLLFSTVTASDGSYEQTWSRSDGSHGTDAFNSTDGSSSGVSYNGDGTSSAYTRKPTPDGGNVTDVKHFDSNGNLQSDTIIATAPDGSPIISRDLNGDGVTDQVETIATTAAGTVDDVKNLDSNSNLQSETITTNDGQGNVQTDNFNADGIKTGDGWQHEDGSHGTDTFDHQVNDTPIAYGITFGTLTEQSTADSTIPTIPYSATASLPILVDGVLYATSEGTFTISWSGTGDQSTFTGDETIAYKNFDVLAENVSLNGVRTVQWSNGLQGGITSDTTAYSPRVDLIAAQAVAGAIAAQAAAAAQTGLQEAISDASSSGISYNADGTSAIYAVTPTIFGGNITDVKNYDSNGNLKNETRTATVPDGAQTIARDLNGDGVTDQVETIRTAANGKVDGVENFGSDSHLLNKTITTNDGQGNIQTDNFNADGSATSDNWTKSDGSHGSDTFNPDRSSSGISCNADGASTTYAVTPTPDGGNITDVKNFDPSGDLQNETSTATAPDGHSIITRDLNGDGVTDQVEAITTTAAGTVDDVKNLDSNSFVQSETITTTATDDSQKVETINTTADGEVDDVKNLDSNGTVQNETVTTTAPDGHSIISRDLNGDGLTDQVETIATTAAGTVDDVKNLDPNSNLQSETITTDDGHGNIQADNFSADGIKTGDSWQHQDGSYGADRFNSDGSPGVITFGTLTYQVTADASHPGIPYTSTTSFPIYVDGMLYVTSIGSLTISWSGTGDPSDFTGDSTAVYDNWADPADHTLSYNGESIAHWYYSSGNTTSSSIVLSTDVDYVAARAAAAASVPGSSSGISHNSDGTSTIYAVTPTQSGGNDSDVKNFDPSGNLQNETITTDDGQGNVQAGNFSPAGTEIGDSWTKSDGSHGSDTLNTDGSGSSITYDQIGNYSIYTNDGQGNTRTDNYRGDGTLLSVEYQYQDGSHGYDIISDGTSDGIYSGVRWFPNGTRSQYIVNGQGNVQTDNFGADGSKTSDSWQHQDGSHGSDTFNPDGSSSGISYNPDGTYNTHTNDGQGDIEADNFGADGIKTGDSWQLQDGSHGTDTINSDGSSSGVSYYGDGTSSAYTRAPTPDGGNVADVKNYGSNGNLQNETSTATVPDGTQTIARDLNGDGVIDQVETNTTTADGSTVVDVKNLDSNSNVQNETITTNDGQGNVQTVNFSADGTKTGDSWTKSDGSHGSDTINADVSGYSSSYNSDGSYSTFTQSADGSSLSNNYDASGQLTGSSSYNAATGESKGISYASDGSYSGYDNIASADGSYSYYSYSSDGSYNRSNYDSLTGDTTQASYQAATGITHTDDTTHNSDGSTEEKVSDVNSDGTYTNSDNITFADGSFQDTSLSSDGSHSTYTGSANGSSVSDYYDGSGQLTGYDTYTVNADGSSEYDSFNADGTKTYDSYENADGISGGFDQYNSDGSSSGTRYNSDGTYSAYTNDGQGDTTTQNYSADRALAGDSWDKAGGYYGSDTYNADGSSSGISENPGGSYSSYIKNSDGSSVTDNFDASSQLTGYSTFVPFDSQDYKADITSNYDANGRLLSDSYTNTFGGLGQDTYTYKSDGSTEAMGSITYSNDSYEDSSYDNVSYTDGSYIYYASNGDGNVSFRLSYDAATGERQGVSYLSDGSYNGYDDFASAGGSYSDNYYWSDGSHANVTYDAATGETKSNTYKSDGSYTIDDRFADGSFNNYYYSNGSSESQSYDASTGERKELDLSPDGSYTSYDDIAYADGSYSDYFSTARGDGSYQQYEQDNYDAATGIIEDFSSTRSSNPYDQAVNKDFGIDTISTNTTAEDKTYYPDGSIEDKLTLTNADGGHSNFDIFTNSDGSYRGAESGVQLENGSLYPFYNNWNYESTTQNLVIQGYFYNTNAFSSQPEETYQEGTYQVAANGQLNLDPSTFVEESSSDSIPVVPPVTLPS